jgi:hypothetical protein
MAERIQCDNCGAVLAKEDIFCGECGAPRLTLAETATIGQPEPSLPEVPSPEKSMPTPPARKSPETGWRIAFIVLVVLGVLACVAGLLAFLVIGSMPSENTTPTQDWLYSALCCLLPIGGTGILLAASGGAIWFSRLRNR